jgi:Tetracyclin repressor-like, C-terminal domain
MRSIFMTQLVPTVTTLTGESRSRAEMRAGLIATQMLGVALCRYVLKLPPVASANRAALARWLGPSIQRYLLDPAPGEMSGRS